MRKIFKLVFAAIFLLLLWTTDYGLSTANAAVPRLINYQGRLTDKANKPLDGVYTITFTIYNAESGPGNMTPWVEIHPNVSIQKGIFSILLGSVTDLGLAFNEPYFMEIKIKDPRTGSEEVMDPRQRITSAGYALMAENTLSIPAGVIVMWSGRIAKIPSGWHLCDGTNGTPDLRDRFVVGARQDSEGVAKTNVSGALTQAGGEATHTLTVTEMPAHIHNVYLRQENTAGEVNENIAWTANTTNERTFPTQAAGAGAAHSILNPYYALAYIMKL
ncbi:MAG: hypothetical protein Q8N85_00350 [Candidatus Omnitrophota bacterium]|nr:hypothetical protein [Candidatus Omnitrophota bacterium]